MNEAGGFETSDSESEFLQNGTVFKTEREKRMEEKEAKKLFGSVLELFGAEDAKNNFLELCKKYYDVAFGDVKYTKVAGGSNFYVKGRSELHNQIMEILQKLSAAQKQGSDGEKIFFELSADRHRVADVIRKYFS